jgi:NlpC/P60 family
MRLLAKAATLSLIACVLITSSWTAEKNGKTESNGASNGSRSGYATARLLNSDQGLAIIGAALEFRHHRAPKPDCSHFVNTIYERAGFPYAYANSIELYSGTDSFHRVSRPQPGDLIVWPGHVGIVVHPAQHSFFSALRSGLGVEDYESPYWRKRGHPRFFRYVQVTPPTVLAADTRVMNAIVPNQDNGEPQAATVEVTNIADTSDSAPAPLALPTSTLSNSTANTIVYSAKPRAEDVRVVLLRKFGDVEQSLRGRDVLRSDEPVTVFDSIEIRKVHIKGNTGWAEARVHGISSVEQGQIKVKDYTLTKRFSLTRRDPGSWEIIVPVDAVYVPRDSAVRIFAHQLASLTDHPDPSAGETEKVQLARLLSVLVRPVGR